MAAIRVYLLACRRPAMLRRALASLLAQTFHDWVCELHNDAPEDDFPRRLVAELADSRITLHHHEKNWGALAAFNHACAGAPEPFFSILEDDNWWAPTLLARLLAALETHPEAPVAWANLRFWRETPDGSWINENRTLWPVVEAQVVPVAQPQLIQFDGPLHSNGAMLVRSSAAAHGRLILPPDVPFAAMENLRERFFRGPLLLVPEPLANFALTLGTARDGRLGRWAGQQALLGAAFLSRLKPPADAVERLWRSRRAVRPRATSGLILAGIVARDLRFLSRAGPRDWIAFAAGFVRRPAVSLAALRATSLQPTLPRLFAEAMDELAANSPSPAAGRIPAFALASPADLPAAWAAVKPRAR
jgi:glycosyltransferase involved in cell wall biosynthesis